MKKTLIAALLGAVTTSMLLSGCGTDSDSDTSSAAAEGSAAEESSSAEGSGESGSSEGTSAGEDGYLITNVYGDGQKPWILVLQYDSAIDPESVSAEDYAIEDYEIAAVYTNTEAEIPEESCEGNYVLVELSTDYTTDNYTTSGGGSSGSTDEDASESDDASGSDSTGQSAESLTYGIDSASQSAESLTYGDSDESSEDASGEKEFRGGGMNGGTDDNSGDDSSDTSGEKEFRGGTGGGTGGGMSNAASEPSNQLTVTWTQTGDIEGTDGTVYAASDESHTTDYSENDNLLVKNFEQDTFETEDGTSMMYSLYIPEDYDEGADYPVVLFMPDATGEGSDAYLALTESLGGVIWTTEENQAENPCIVLIPQYEDDNTTDPAYTMELLQSVIDAYSADESRLYLVGQSSGTIRSIKLMIDYPDTFAGAMLVAGQPDSDYEDQLRVLADQNIWMICSAGDERAYPGMTSITEAVEEAGTTVTQAGWSADLTDEEQEALAAEQADAGTSINFTVYDEGTVMEDDVPVSTVTEHMNTWRVAYDLDTVRNWLLAQVNE